MDSQRVVLAVERLTAQAFTSYGNVIEAQGDASFHLINSGFGKRFDDLAAIDTSAAAGRTVVSIVRTLPHALPFNIVMLERHVLGSQAFVPLSGQPFLVVVAPAGQLPDTPSMRCFLCGQGQGINYAPGTWHHPLLGIGAQSDFLVIDRAGPPGEVDCEEHWFKEANTWIPTI